MTRLHTGLLCALVALLVWSAIRPHDYFTWFLEVFPALAAFCLLALTFRRFRFTDLAYTLMAAHAMILIIGAHYTYAEVPLFNWLRDAGVFERNNYDKIGHFAQGFVPAIVAREILFRTSPLGGSRWLWFLSASVCLALSALYEMVEWWVSLLTGSAGDSFLGTQGYIWDTQSDMLMCLIGSLTALALLSRAHDRALRACLAVDSQLHTV
jgi:putative membrane protein